MTKVGPETLIFGFVIMLSMFFMYATSWPFDTWDWWINRYQTLLTGIFAIAGALLAWIASNRSTAISRKQLAIVALEHLEVRRENMSEIRDTLMEAPIFTISTEPIERVGVQNKKWPNNDATDKFILNRYSIAVSGDLDTFIRVLRDARYKLSHLLQARSLSGPVRAALEAYDDLLVIAESECEEINVCIEDIRVLGPDSEQGIECIKSIESYVDKLNGHKYDRIKFDIIDTLEDEIASIVSLIEISIDDVQRP